MMQEEREWDITASERQDWWGYHDTSQNSDLAAHRDYAKATKAMPAQQL